MKSLVCVTPHEFEYRDSKLPELQHGFSMIRIARIGVCGTDLHAFEGTQPYFSYPRILGHELAGEYIRGDADGFRSGERVTFIPYFHCGRCIACRHGKENCCTDMKVCGVHVDGGMREYLTVPSHSLIHGDDHSFDELALVEPLAIGAHGIRRAGVEIGEYVLVVGAGPIGLGTMEFARIAGANVIALDMNEARLKFCRERLKIKHTINASQEDEVECLKKITDGEMPTVVIDATGNLNAITKSFSYMAHGARYILIGLQKAEIAFSHPEFHKREGTLMSSRNATREDFDQVLRSMKNGEVDPTTYITHRVGFDEVKSEFEGWLNPAKGVIKAMISVDHE